MKPILGILLGEATGIGPEIIAKMCYYNKLSPYCRPILLGDARVLQMGKEIAGVDFSVKIVECAAQASWGEELPMIDLKNLDPAEIKLGEVNESSGRITGGQLTTAMKLCQRGEIAGFMYAPLNKEALQRGGYDFKDEHKIFTHYLETTGLYGEMNMLNDLWTSRVTSHIPLKDVAGNISIDKVVGAIELAHDTLSRAGFNKPRIAVSAINPHGGEGGLCGREELDLIGPAVKEAQDKSIAVTGPHPSDTIFLNAFNGQYDAVVTMYHDQGQIAMKLKGFQYGVTVAAGQPYPITTPCHGTAFDIVGKGIANIDATEQAVKIAAKMAKTNNVK